MCAAEVSDGPFPWNKPLDSLTGGTGAPLTSSSRPQLAEDPGAGKEQITHQYLVDNPRVMENTERLMYEIRAEKLPLVFRLPRRGLLAGAVLQHSIRVVEEYFKRLEPLVFKFGWTHNPIWRWTNSLYGYCQDKDIWSEMIILHASHEAFGPAMLEAALINQYQSNSQSIRL